MFRNQLLRLGATVTLAIFLLVWWLHLTTPPLRPEQPLQGLAGWRVGFSEADLDLLARAVQAEAKGEPPDGQIAVAAVILNRVLHPQFPNTIAGVIYEPLAFSVVANGQIYKPANAQAMQAAHAALNGLDPTGGALYFYNPRKTGSTWIKSRPVLKKIGNHVFSG